MFSLISIFNLFWALNVLENEENLYETNILYTSSEQNMWLTWTPHPHTRLHNEEVATLKAGPVQGAY